MRADRSTCPQTGFYHYHLQIALHFPHAPTTQGPECQVLQHHWLFCWQNNHRRKSCSKAHSLSRQALSCSNSSPLPPHPRHSHSTAERVKKGYWYLSDCQQQRFQLSPDFSLAIHLGSPSH